VSEERGVYAAPSGGDLYLYAAGAADTFLAERDRARSLACRLEEENEALHDDLARTLELRNLALRIAAAEVLPGPDGQDDLDRERLIQRWLDDAHDEVAWDRPLIAQLQHRILSLEGERERLKAAILDIDAHATPLGEDDDGFVSIGYAVSVGSIHRALGLVGHTAPKCRDLPCERAARLEGENAALREALEEIELEASMADARGVYTGDDNWRILCDARAALARAAADEHTRLWADEITASPVQEESDG
jgi:hypothetical protein